VTHVQLALGVCGHLTAEAAHQSFEMLIKGTPIEGSSLAIQWLPARYQCLICRHNFESGEPCEQVLCPQCGEVALEVVHQEICTLRSIDVSFPVVPETAGSWQPDQKPWPAPISLIASEYALTRG
jgi:Zn finger protein HypA/HybF involved in hydrogenase expression